MTAPVFQAPPTRNCEEKFSTCSGALLNCDLEAHEDEVHYDENEDLYWSFYPVQPVQ